MKELSRAFELEPCPLRDEILAIAERFGIRIRSILIQTAPFSHRTRWVQELQRFAASRIDLPIPKEVLQDLEPDQLTACLAVAWAQNTVPDSWETQLKRRGLYWPALIFLLLVLLAGMVAVVHFLALWTSFRGMLLLTVPLALTWLTGYALAGFPRFSTALRHAYHVWADADGSAQRTIVDFLMTQCDMAAPEERTTSRLEKRLQNSEDGIQMLYLLRECDPDSKLPLLSYWITAREQWERYVEEIRPEAERKRRELNESEYDLRWRMSLRNWDRRRDKLRARFFPNGGGRASGTGPER